MQKPSLDFDSLATSNFYDDYPLDKNSLRDYLKIPSSKRTPEHCREIIGYLSGIKFFVEYFKSGNIMELAQDLRIASYHAKCPVFREGDPADTFYIILSGSVRIFVNVPSETKRFTKLKEISKLKKGETLGEVGLLTDAFRNATAITDEPTELILLDKENFRKHNKTMKTTNLTNLINFYKHVPMLASLSEIEIAKLASKSIIYRYPGNAIILRQDEVPSDVYFVKNGKVKVVRKVRFRTDPQTGKIIYGDSDDPNSFELKHHIYQSSLLEIDELSSGESFGDYALITSELVQQSYITAIPSEIISLPSFDIRRTFSKSQLNEYKLLIGSYPSDKDLKTAFFDKVRWASWKTKMIKNIQIEKNNRKKGFSGQLREPWQRLAKLDEVDSDLQLLVEPSEEKHVKTRPRIKSNSISVSQTGSLGPLSAKAKLGRPPNLSKFHGAEEFNNDGTDLNRIIQNSGKNKTAKMNMNRDTIGQAIHHFAFITPQHKLRSTSSLAFSSPVSPVNDSKNVYDKKESQKNSEIVRKNGENLSALDKFFEPRKTDPNRKLITVEKSVDPQIRINVVMNKDKDNAHTDEFSKFGRTFSEMMGGILKPEQETAE